MIALYPPERFSAGETISSCPVLGVLSYSGRRLRTKEQQEGGGMTDLRMGAAINRGDVSSSLSLQPGRMNGSNLTSPQGLTLGV